MEQRTADLEAKTDISVCVLFSLFFTDLKKNIDVGAENLYLQVKLCIVAYSNTCSSIIIDSTVLFFP